MSMTGQDVALRAALRLYPARYRRERGEELTAVFADTTATEGRLATAREVFDLGSYGLRVRTGLTAASPGGRLFALAAPLAAGAVAGVAGGMKLAWLLFGYGRPNAFGLSPLPDGPAEATGFLMAFGQSVLPLLLVAAVLLGHWRSARTFALVVAAVGLLRMAEVVPASESSWWTLYLWTSAAPYLLAGLVFALAPLDLLEPPTWRSRAAVVASVAGGVLLVLLQGGYDTHLLLDGASAAVLLLVPLLAVLGAVRGWLGPAAVGLAVLPLTVGYSTFRLWQVAGGVWRLLPAAVAVAVVGTVLAKVGGAKTVGE